MTRSNFGIEVTLLTGSLREQKAIVAKLGTLFAHVDQLRALLGKILVLLKPFRQAVLTQAVAGKLTEYRLRPLSSFEIQVQTTPVGSSIHKEDYIIDGIPVINPSHFNNREILPDKSATLAKSNLKELSSWILNGVMLYSGEEERHCHWRSYFGRVTIEVRSEIE